MIQSHSVYIFIDGDLDANKDYYICFILFVRKLLWLIDVAVENVADKTGRQVSKYTRLSKSHKPHICNTNLTYTTKSS